MPPGLRPFAALIASIAIAAALGTSPAGEPGARGRLRGLPIERRYTLDENLRRFDALGRPERDALLSLDASLAALPAEERDRYFELARRYHLWFSGLSDSRRKALVDAPPARRIALVVQYRDEERRATLAARTDDPIWTLSPTFNPTTFGEEALQARCWQELNTAQKDEILAETFPQKRIARLMRMTEGRRFGRRNEYAHIISDLNTFIKKYDEDVRKFNEELPKKSPELKGNALALRPNWAALDPPSKAKAIRVLEDRHFHAHEPPTVAAHELAHFEAGLPPWIRERIAAFPPEAARWRLAILHYLASPNPGVEPKPAPPKRAIPSKSSKTTRSESPAIGSALARR